MSIPSKPPTKQVKLNLDGSSLNLANLFLETCMKRVDRSPPANSSLQNQATPREISQARIVEISSLS
ncbi:MAG: hypothetical protein CMM07_23185 [Rhodopirellula sp.]|nr:hypothetical protein [Rhodopirellula sp.]